MRRRRSGGQLEPDTGRRTVGPVPRPKPATPHNARAPEGAGYGRRNITVSRAPPGNIASRPRARRRRGAWNRCRGRGGFPRERHHEGRHPPPVRRGPFSRGSRTNREGTARNEFHSAPFRPRDRNRAPSERQRGTFGGGARWGPPLRAEARQPHIARAPGGTGYGSGNRTVSPEPPGSVTGIRISRRGLSVASRSGRLAPRRGYRVRSRASNRSRDRSGAPAMDDRGRPRTTEAPRDRNEPPVSRRW